MEWIGWSPVPAGLLRAAFGQALAVGSVLLELAIQRGGSDGELLGRAHLVAVVEREGRKGPLPRQLANPFGEP